MRWVISVAAASAAVTVVIGAASAHSRADMSDIQIGWIDTALRYQVWNTIGLLAVGILGQIWQSSKLLNLSAIALTIGISLFSGSLYIMATTNSPDLGVVTPVGGLCLIAGWSMLAVAGLTQKPKQSQL